MGPSVKDLKQIAAKYPHRAWIYWTDLAVASGAAWGSLVLVCTASLPPAAVVGLVVLAAVAQLRAVYFVHEIVHFPRGAVPWFGAVWFVVAGMPSLVPRFMVDPHVHHHRASSYGTSRDPEYAHVPGFSRARLVAEAFVLVLAPPALVVRFGVLAPLSWVIPPLRQLVVGRLSALATQPSYVRPACSPRSMQRLVREEIACAAFVWSVALGIVGGVLPLRVAFVWWASAGLALLVNGVRTFVAHDYQGAPTPANLEGQVRDTLTLNGSWATELIAPLGTRHHAIHHLLPNVPYHSLRAAQRDVSTLSPGWTALQRGQRDGIAAALVRVWRRAAISGAGPRRHRRASPAARTP